MAIVTIDAETGDTSQFSSTTQDGGNTLTATTGSNIHGTYGFEIDFAGTDRDCFGRYNFSSSQSDIYVRVYFNIQELGLADATFIDFFNLYSTYDTSWPVYFQLYQIGTGTSLGYRLFVDGTRVINKYNIATFTEGTNHYIEIHYKVDASVGGWEFWVDGSSEGSDFTLDTSGNDIGTIVIGSDRSSIPSSSGLIYFDDLEADTSYIGAYSSASSSVPVLMNTFKRIRG